MPKKVKISDHVLVPKHIKIGRKRAKKILEKMGLKEYELPWILTSDPIVRELGAKPGDIIMIIRESPTAGRSVVLRIVMPGGGNV